MVYLSSILLIKMKLREIINYKKTKSKSNNNYLQKYLIKELSSSIRVLEVLYRAQSWTRLHRWWLLWSWSRHCFWETLIFIYSDRVFGWSCFLPRKEEVVGWLSHIFWVRHLGVVHFHMLRNFLHHSHFFKLVLCHGYLCHMMLVEILSHHFQHVPVLDCDVHSHQKNSRDCFSHLNLY